ncbi:hypothetical protein DIPPA_10794 [Diplonema papillatum]|nr:hypothetical protein DIPPA_10794 [Diplonema papillatum]
MGRSDWNNDAQHTADLQKTTLSKVDGKHKVEILVEVRNKDAPAAHGGKGGKAGKSRDPNPEPEHHTQPPHDKPRHAPYQQQPQQKHQQQQQQQPPRSKTAAAEPAAAGKGGGRVGPKAWEGEEQAPGKSGKGGGGKKGSVKGARPAPGRGEGGDGEGRSWGADDQKRVAGKGTKGGVAGPDYSSAAAPQWEAGQPSGSDRGQPAGRAGKGNGSSRQTRSWEADDAEEWREERPGKGRKQEPTQQWEAGQPSGSDRGQPAGRAGKGNGSSRQTRPWEADDAEEWREERPGKGRKQEPPQQQQQHGAGKGWKANTPSPQQHQQQQVPPEDKPRPGKKQQGWEAEAEGGQWAAGDNAKPHGAKGKGPRRAQPEPQQPQHRQPQPEAAKNERKRTGTAAANSADRPQHAAQRWENDWDAGEQAWAGRAEKNEDTDEGKGRRQPAADRKTGGNRRKPAGEKHWEEEEKKAGGEKNHKPAGKSYGSSTQWEADGGATSEGHDRDRKAGGNRRKPAGEKPWEEEEPSRAGGQQSEKKPRGSPDYDEDYKAAGRGYGNRQWEAEGRAASEGHTGDRKAGGKGRKPASDRNWEEEHSRTAGQKEKNARGGLDYDEDYKAAGKGHGGRQWDAEGRKAAGGGRKPADEYDWHETRKKRDQPPPAEAAAGKSRSDAAPAKRSAGRNASWEEGEWEAKDGEERRQGGKSRRNGGDKQKPREHDAKAAPPAREKRAKPDRERAAAPPQPQTDEKPAPGAAHLARKPLGVRAAEACAVSTKTFSDMDLMPLVCEALARENITHPLPLQDKCALMGLRGYDVYALAGDHAGKTLAWVILALTNMIRAGGGGDGRSVEPGVLVLAATAPRAERGASFLTRLDSPGPARTLAHAGAKAAAYGAEALIVTPAVAAGLLRERQLSLRRVHTFVVESTAGLAKAAEQHTLSVVRAVALQCRGPLQTIAFSSTMEAPVDHLLRDRLIRKDRVVYQSVLHALPRTVGHTFAFFKTSDAVALRSTISKLLEVPGMDKVVVLVPDNELMHVYRSVQAGAPRDTRVTLWDDPSSAYQHEETRAAMRNDAHAVAVLSTECYPLFDLDREQGDVAMFVLTDPSAAHAFLAARRRVWTRTCRVFVTTLLTSSRDQVSAAEQVIADLGLPLQVREARPSTAQLVELLLSEDEPASEPEPAPQPLYPSTAEPHRPSQRQDTDEAAWQQPKAATKVGPQLSREDRIIMVQSFTEDAHLDEAAKDALRSLTLADAEEIARTIGPQLRNIANPSREVVLAVKSKEREYTWQ